MNGASSSGTKGDEVRKVSHDQAVDFFSSLPDNIITAIFSFLTMKEAVYTCVSCKRLQRLITSIPNIEFEETADDSPFKRREFVQTVSRFLRNHDNRVGKFQLSYRPHKDGSRILDWLSLVVKEGIEEVDLQFGGLYLKIPVSLLAASSLKVLKLRHCALDNMASITGFKSLEMLLLRSMFISDDVMDLLCSHCASLQKLTLEECQGFEQVQIVHPSSNLKTLILDDCYEAVYSLNISSLKKLVIRKERMDFSFIGCPQIDSLFIYREKGPSTPEEAENMKVNIINRLRNVRSLQLSGLAFECFAAFRWIGYHQFTNLKVLDLEIIFCPKNLKELNNLICLAGSLKTLIIQRDRIYGWNLDTMSAYFVDNNAGIGYSRLENIDIRGFTGRNYEVNYIKFVLAHFRHLRSFVVRPIIAFDEDQCRSYQDLFSRFPRASTGVRMLVESEASVET